MEKQIEQSNLHGYKRIIFTFDIPPKSEVLGVESKVIITNDEKEYVFEKSGIDYLIECPFVPQVMTMEADAFVRWIVKSLNVKCIIVGDDFRLGTTGQETIGCFLRWQESLDTSLLWWTR